MTTATLTALDRCDRCGARATTTVALQAGELLFCTHHARQYGEALAPMALSITKTGL